MEKLEPHQKEILTNLLNSLKITTDGTKGGVNEIIKNNSGYILDSIFKGNFTNELKREYLYYLSYVFKDINPDLCQYIQGEADFINYNQLLGKLDELEEIFNIKRNHESLINLLIFALYVLNPPLKNIYNDIIYINDEKQATDETKNYILKVDYEYTIIYNASKYKRVKMQIKSERLKNILNKYIFTYCKPNKYLFTNDEGKPYTKNRIKYILKVLLKVNNKALTIDYLRKTYIYYFRSVNTDLLERQELAQLMGLNITHSNLLIY